MSRHAQSLQALERPPTPGAEDLYRTRALPTPPSLRRSDSKRLQRLSSISRMSSRRAPSDVQPSRPIPRVLPLSRYHSERINSSPALSRRSSLKIKQLTGCEPDLLDDPEAFERDVTPPVCSARTSSSSEYSLSFDAAILEAESTPAPLRLSRGSGPPPLDQDSDAVSSKSNSWTPKTPRNIPLASGYYSTAPPSMEHVPTTNATFAECPPGRHWRTYSYFSDAETADEYHKITSDLATYPGRDTICEPRPSSSASRGPPGRLSFSSKMFGSRRRNPPRPLLARSASATGDRPLRTPYPPATSPVPELTVSSTPCSVFESDDDDEEEGEEERDVRESLIGFFRPRSTPESSADATVPRSQQQGAGRPDMPGLFTRTGGQVKGLLANARQGAKKLHVSRTEKRRNQLRSQIRVIPEANNEQEKNFF